MMKDEKCAGKIKGIKEADIGNVFEPLKPHPCSAYLDKLHTSRIS